MVIWNISNLENSQDVFNGSVGLYNVIPSQRVNSKNFKIDSINTLSEGTDYTKMFDIQFSQKSLDDSVLINGIDSIFKGFENDLCATLGIESKLNSSVSMVISICSVFTCCAL